MKDESGFSDIYEYEWGDEIMELCKLEQNEHGKTRGLWEQVFEEDTKAFLDYYYFFKTRDNEIFVIEEDGEVRSMLQLNPYIIQVEEEQFAGNYIIAVATDKAYRKRGYMGQLLRQSMHEMYKRKELFAFLMPAAEEIYLPYDFRFVYDQNVWVYTIHVTDSSVEQGEKLYVTEAGIGDGAELAEFFNTYFAEMFQVYAVRDEKYYQTLLFEQQSENGGIRLLKKDGEIVGSFLYGDEDGVEIREPLYRKEYENEFWEAVGRLCEKRERKQAVVYAGIDSEITDGAESSEVGRKIEISGLGEIQVKQRKPIIMVRILHLESLLKTLKVKSGEEVDCSFAVLDAFLPQNSRVWRVRSKSLIPSENELSGNLQVQETEDSEGVITIGALTSLLFGYKTIEEVAEEENVYLTERLMAELTKIQPLNTVYLNEIV